MNLNTEHTEPKKGYAQRRQRNMRIKGNYCVIIPALNESATIGSIVKGVKRLGLAAVVVDDGSSDNTAVLASQEGAVVISHVKTRGKGCAIRAGIDYALRHEYEAVIMCDGDGQHEIRDLMRLAYEAERQHAAFALGNRMENTADMPPLRRVANRWASNILSWLTKFDVPDSQCGLRMIRKEVLEDMKLRAEYFEIESELLLACSHRRWKIISVPIKTVYNGEHSAARPVRDAFRFIGLVGRFALFRSK